jgi:hypothetical protein
MLIAIANPVNWREGADRSVGWPFKADPEQEEIMNGECEERAPRIRSFMIFPCAARAWKPKLQLRGALQLAGYYMQSNELLRVGVG